MERTSRWVGIVKVILIACVLWATLVGSMFLLGNPPLPGRADSALPEFAESSSMQAIEAIPPTWQRTTITYRITNCPSSMDCELAHQAVRDALEQLSAVSGLTLTEVQRGGDILLSWESGAHGDHNDFDGKGGRVAHAAYPYNDGNSPLDGDVHFDDEETWVVSDIVKPYPEEIHLPTAALHEIGHALGLDHSETTDSIMWPVYTGISDMTQADIDAIQSIYGPPNGDDQ